MAAAEDNVDDTGPLVYCLEAGAVTPTKAQAKCEDGVAKSLIKFAGAKGKCYDKCVDQEFKGKIPAGSCTTGGPSDAATPRQCIEKAEDKATGGHRQGVRGVGREAAVLRPERDSGAEWTAVVENLVDAHVPLLYCSSPSGAFLD